ncbi:MAG: adenylosuccinate synthase [Planctomycetales bacterium]|nr:adenylosuccinate synthase [Planctomycetales bacterium]
MSSRVVVGLQWGDEGKGKVIDVLAGEADLVVRYQGGGNAGHTVQVGHEHYVLHLVPAGILRPGTTCVIGGGCVVDPELLLAEIAQLESRGHRVQGRLVVSARAHLVLPAHKRWDVLRDKGANRIGTTGRGIGPCYADKVARTGVRVGDLRDPDLFGNLTRANVAEKNTILSALYGEPPSDPEEVVKRYLYFAERLLPHVGDAEARVREALGSGKRVLFEGAQGLLLDVDAGTYPFVTGSSAGPGGVATGAGVPPSQTGDVVGVVKAYATRVGEGPFPTELPPEEAARLRERGAEFGATTGRPRRCGWFDAVASRYAAAVSGADHLAVTKLDILGGEKKLRLAVAYKLDGRETTEFPGDAVALHRAEPVYRELPGWTEDITDVTSEARLPEACRRYLDAIEEEVGVPASLVSVGPERRQSLARGVEVGRE